VASKRVVKKDYETLVPRMEAVPANEAERNRLSNAPYLIDRNKLVEEFNAEKHEHLNNMGHRICRIDAHNTGRGSQKAKADDMRGLETSICLARGCRGMITNNLWVEMGIVNGFMGDVRHIIFAEVQAPPSLPIAVIVELDDRYKGPHLPDRPCYIVVEPKTVSADGKERRQLPLRLCYAISLHKTQGQTLKIGRVNIGARDWTPALASVALSRFTTLNGIYLDRIDFERLKNNKVPSDRNAHDLETQFLIQQTKEEFGLNST
jgi:hypothetical protein